MDGLLLTSPPCIICAGMAVRENEPLKIFMEQPDCDVIQIVDDYCLCRRFAEDSGVLATALEKDIGVVQAAPMCRLTPGNDLYICHRKPSLCLCFGDD